MFYADLHIHSKFSRATSRDADLEHMAIWARKKGVSVLGTGDFTHPAWFAEIQEKLVPAEPGLFRLRDDLAREVDRNVPGPAGGMTRFMLEVEISTIYKKRDQTRKVHHLVYAPDLEKARRFIEQLSRIGNLQSDGRPILGLDSRDLLEIALTSGEGCYLVPAHIWTPWFAVLGSKSGFDAVEECYGDLTPEIFALETGLSSDPPMNWRLSQLDRYQLVSNSDAHSPPKIGREACVFETEMDYFAMRRALETGKAYGGTVEFFPEEGKYHLDGHRKCNIRLSPTETRQHAGMCPACGKELTVGVMNRVDQLADRPERFEPEQPTTYRSLIPLPEVIAEIRGVGENSKKVQCDYEEVIAKVGSELFVLERAPVEELRRAGVPVLAEALERMRAGHVIREAGFDGEYGTIRLFEKGELARGGCVSMLFDMSELGVAVEQGPAAQESTDAPSPLAPFSPPTVPPWPRPDAGTCRARAPGVAANQLLDELDAVRDRRLAPAAHVGAANRLLDELDPEQRVAAETVHGPLLVIAGPGTGKTRTLTHRIAHLVADHQVPPERCLAITFSRRAAVQMSEQLGRLLPDVGDRVPVMTFHALGLTLLRAERERLGLPQRFRVADDAERIDLLRERLKLTERRAGRLLAEISRMKRSGAAIDPDEEIGKTRAAYERHMREQGLVDFDDLIELATRLLRAHPDLSAAYQLRWPWVSVDELQDIDDGQYQLLRQLVPPEENVCAIGDPDQSIYGFRGSMARSFERFMDNYPAARVIRLARNYRSSRTIVRAALQAIEPSTLVGDRQLEAMSDNFQRIEIHACPSERAEAEFVIHTIERMIGGTTLFSMDSGRVEPGEGDALSFSDFAVLYRTDAQSEPLVEAFARSGIPFQKKSHARLADQPAVQAMIRFLGNLVTSDESTTTKVPLVELLKRATDAVRVEHPEADTYLADMGALAERSDGDLDPLLAHLALGMDADLWDPRAQAVSLLTLHAAKGLEFPVVFLVGCEDGLLPLRWGQPTECDLAEERRLFFVGITRARDRLFLSHARERWWRGKIRKMPPSPLLEPIEEALLARQQRTGKQKLRANLQRQLGLFGGL